MKARKGWRERFTLLRLPTRHLLERSVPKFVALEQPGSLEDGAETSASADASPSSKGCFVVWTVEV